jgi:hypothetical protein
MLMREKIEIARMRKSMGAPAKAVRKKVRADLSRSQEALRARLAALPYDATGHREKVASEIAALSRLLRNPLMCDPPARLRARMLALRRQFVPLLPTRTRRGAKRHAPT